MTTSTEQEAFSLVVERQKSGASGSTRPSGRVRIETAA